MPNDPQQQPRNNAPAPLNPFGAAQRAPTANAAIDVAQSKAIAEIQGAMLIAQRFPRDEVAAMDKILNAFTRPSLAEVAQYEYSKGGSEVRGASIRSLEAIAQLWGHIHSGMNWLEQRADSSTVETFAFDAQTGSRDSKVFQVDHLRYLGAKNGMPARTYKLEDPREIYEHIANLSSRRKRACMLAVIPGDVVEAAMKQADITLHTKAEVTPERIASLVEKFAEYGINKEAIEKRIQRRIDTMSPAQMVNLGRIYNSLRDGMSVPAEWFDLAPVVQIATTDTKPSKSAGSALKGAATKGRADEKKDAKPDAGKAAAKADAAPTYPEVRAQLEAAKNTDAVDVAESLVDGLPEQFRAELHDLAKARRAALSGDVPQ